MPGITLNIPEADSIDYGNSDEICGYQLLLSKMFELAGGLNVPSTSNREIISIQREGLIWLNKVKGVISSLFMSSIPPDTTDLKINLGDIPAIIGAYDFLYRVCHGSPCFDFIKDIRFKTANRWVKGDRSISEAQVALMLRREINRDIRKVEERYLNFSGSVMDSWINDLNIYGTLKGLSSEDAYQVLDFLLRSDLFAFGVKKEDKLKWIRTYSLSDVAIDRLDTGAFWAYSGFEQSAAFIVGKSLSEQDEQYTRFLSRILAHPDLNRFIREAITLELAKYQAA